MGIYIKGMEMPESCIYLDKKANTKFCFFCNHDNTPFCTYRGTGLGLEGKRPDWCPLVEILEPHGRLIDADRLLNDATRYVGSPPHYERMLARLEVKLAPTVIEAEGSENE